ncbi:uncharacterized protein [Aegilops tauschii subsp. strangulata]|uniref:uncharacterized protein n=1 Tax=Aegilops tauschii subsp. strangulata TaxID=200361 RepID=UPI003CC8DCB8
MAMLGKITLDSIIEEIGGDVFSLLIDEGADVSDKEQMAVVLRYLSKRGFIIERLVGIEHVKETSVTCLKATLQKLFMKIGLSINQSLQRKDQDILNAISCVKSTRNELQELRDNGWDSLLEKAYSFCEEHHIENANMQKQYLQEFDDRFNEVNSALLGHMASFNPKDSFAAFNLDNLVKLADFYPDDFDSRKMDDLGPELRTYIDNMRADESISGEMLFSYECCQEKIALQNG